MESWLINGALGFLIGLTLGFLGGGGSILTVPVLVYIVGQNPQTAISASLFIVGANATMGALFHRGQGTLNWRIALLFGSVGMVTAYAAAGLSKLVPSTVLMILFALLMLVVGVVMFFGRAPQNQNHCTRCWLPTIGSGAAVGILTGFLGVGGGFLIVPALVMLVGLPIQQAVGTSLVIIAMNSLAGLLGHLGDDAQDMMLIGIFVVTGFAGAFSGSRLARIIHPDRLRTSFAIFVIVLGGALFIDNLGRLF